MQFFCFNYEFPTGVLDGGQRTDDIEYIAQYSTENVLMTGTDYGHVDMSVEIDALRTLEKNGKVRGELARKILYDNPARFYGIQ